MRHEDKDEIVDVLVIGAGVIGLAIASNLVSTHDVVAVVDQEKSFGNHTSSRNSEVIHSGVYYDFGTLKAQLCVEGNKKLYQFVESEGIPYRRCGKIIISTSPTEDLLLDKIYEKGIQNGVSNLEFLTSEQVSQKESEVTSRRGLWVPSTGIIDSHLLMKSLETNITSAGGILSYRTEVVSIRREEENYLIKFQDGTHIRANYLINSAGLWSDKIARMLGIDEYRIRYCKGEYFRTTRYKNMQHLIYPVPDPSGSSLGIHTRLFLSGEVAFGPNAHYVDSMDYNMDESHRIEFVNAVRKYLNINKEDISPDYAGIRPKLFRNGNPVGDFVIEEEGKRGLPGFINLLGIESPGLTCCLSIATKVKALIDTVSHCKQ